MIELIKIKRKYINYILGKLSKGDILDELELSLNKEPANIELFFLYVAILEVSEDSIEYNKLKMHGTEDMLEYINFLSFSEEEKRSYLEDLFEKGNRSAFLYAHTYELYEKDTNLSENLKISFLRWANTHKIKLTKINDYSLKRDLNLFRNVYAKNKNTEILKNLCIAQMEAKDYSLAAYFHYKKLYEKQIYTREFNEALIKAAYTNKRDDISLFPIKKYLENWQAEKDEDILAFIIDLAIQKEPRLIDKYNLKAKIIELVLKSYNNGNNLKKEEAGSGQNLKLSISIEAFCLLNFKGDLTKDIVTNIEKNILDELFLYEVFPRNKKVKQIYVSSNEKKEAKHYTLSEEFNNGNKLNENSLLNMPYVSNINGFKVTALEDFQIMGLDDSGIFIYSKYKIKERVPGKKDLYKYFYMKGV
ncbi:MAG: hypothetical protein FWF50_00300, partial [Defluviitaleaceae bacterium]|nr:hypothetical protein [Defluviitaleaceae bacterium]